MPFGHHLGADQDVDAAVTNIFQNFDNRSFRLNFEITSVIIDPVFASDVEAMFETDFAESRLMVPKLSVVVVIDSVSGTNRGFSLCVSDCAVVSLASVA